MKHANTVITVLFTAILGWMLFASISSGDSYAYWTEIISILVLWIPAILGSLQLFVIPWPVLASAGSALSLHCAGLFMGLYYSVSWWDTLTHFFSGIVVALFVTIFMLIAISNARTISVPVKWVPFLIIISVVAFEGMWEIMEFAVDMTMGTSMQFDISDTVDDISTCAVAGVVAGVGAMLYLRRTSIPDAVRGMKADRIVNTIRAQTLR